MGKWSKQNLYYALCQQDSLIYGNSLKNDQLNSLSFNQHLFDSELIYQVEIDEDESQADREWRAWGAWKASKVSDLSSS